VIELTALMALTVDPMEPATAPAARTMVPIACHRRAANEMAPGWMRAQPEGCLIQAAKIAQGQQVAATLKKQPVQAPAHIASHNRAAADLEHLPVEAEVYIVLRFPQKSPKNVFSDGFS
jgi:hypothetical protein